MLRWFLVFLSKSTWDSIWSSCSPICMVCSLWTLLIC